MLAAALVFVWAGIQFTQFAWNRTSELADLPLWLIHVAWPVTGVTWIVFLGEQIVDDLKIVLGRARMTGAVLSPGTAALILFGLFFLLMFLRVPVAFALGLACLPILVIEPRLDTMTLMQETFNAYNSFILLAVPFFLLTANLMNVGGTTDRLMKLSRTMVGHFPGGLAQINVVLSIFFAGISGSSTADAASQSKIFIEAQTKEGYDLSFSVAITAVSAVLAVIIPAVDPDDRVGRHSHGLDRRAVPRRHHPRPADRPGADGDRARLRQGARLSRPIRAPPGASSSAPPGSSIPALMTPGIIIGGKIFGWFTATESACIAVLYAGVLSLLVYREMDMKGLYGALLDTGKLAGIALFCVGTASTFGWLLAYYKIPEAILAGVSAWGMGFAATGFFIAFVFLVVGCFLDAIPAIIICAPILEPLAKARGDGPGAFRHDRHRLAGLRPRHAALRAVPDDRLLGRRHPHPRCDQGHRHHADPDAGGAGAGDRLAEGVAVPAEPDLAGVPQVGPRPRRAAAIARLGRTAGACRAA